MLRKSSAVMFVAGLIFVLPLIACATPVSPAAEDDPPMQAERPSRDGRCLSDRPGTCAARFPAELLGTWQGDGSTCTLPGNPDSDVQFEIRPDRLLGYEHWNQLSDITQVATRPKAWKVNTLLHIDEQAYEHQEIYVLHGARQDQLTIVDEGRSAVYARCK